MTREFDQLESRRRALLADPQYLRDLQELGSRGTPPPYQTAALGQRYQNLPPASFDERFGATFDRMRPSPEYIRGLFQREMLNQAPEVRPLDYQERFGDPTKRMLQNVPPSLGNTQLAGDIVQGNFPISGPRVRLPSGKVVPLSTFQQPSTQEPAYAPGRGRDPYLSIVPKDVRSEDLTRMQLAGDVVPLRPGAAPQIPQTGSQGQQSIEAAGGKQGPKLDLMDVLKFPGKRSEAPPVKSPMEALSGVIPSQLLDGYMGQPGAVASITEWSKAYDRLARMGAKPGAVALFRIATRNLGNTLGTKVSAEDFMGGTSG